MVIDQQGGHIATRRVSHTAAGLQQVPTFLQECVHEMHDADAPTPDQLACSVAINHGSLIAALLEAGFAVYPVKPNTLERRRSPAGAKTDKLDASLLAKTGRSALPDLRRVRLDSAVIQELKVLTRDQATLIQSQTRLVNQLTACLTASDPVALTLFSKLQHNSTLPFVQSYPTPAAAQAATIEELAACLKQGRHPHAQPQAQRIWDTLQQPHVQADAITTRTKARLMLALVSQVLPVLEQSAAYDTAMTQVCATHPAQGVFASLPGAGMRLAPRLLAEWGDDRTRSATAANMHALAGTAPVPYHSGTDANVHHRYAWSKPLRTGMDQCAWQSTCREAWARDDSHQKLTEGKRQSMAVRCVATIWVRILFRVWQQETTSNTQTFLAARQAHARHAACGKVGSMERHLVDVLPTRSRQPLDIEGLSSVLVV